MRPALHATLLWTDPLAAPIRSVATPAGPSGRPSHAGELHHGPDSGTPVRAAIGEICAGTIHAEPTPLGATCPLLTSTSPCAPEARRPSSSTTAGVSSFMSSNRRRLSSDQADGRTRSPPTNAVPTAPTPLPQLAPGPDDRLSVRYSSRSSIAARSSHPQHSGVSTHTEWGDSCITGSDEWTQPQSTCGILLTMSRPASTTWVVPVT